MSFCLINFGGRKPTQRWYYWFPFVGDAKTLRFWDALLERIWHGVREQFDFLAIL